MATLTKRSARRQEDLASSPFDSWTRPAGGPIAHFHRQGDDILLRFPQCADFEIRPGSEEVVCHPVPGIDETTIDNVFYNSIRPLLINHGGGLALHGSACSTPYGAIAFVGLSRSGKTTLAGACAKVGNPFLTEDVIELQFSGDAYRVIPQRPLLRVFSDTADYLRQEREGENGALPKVALKSGKDLPFASEAADLVAIYVLGAGEATEPTFKPLEPQHALAEIMQHAFVLDVEDKPRLRAHFNRLSDLALKVPFVALDYRRQYDALPSLVEAVVEDARSRGT
ncbi:hypothetical protein OZN62_08725 [Aurantiacibacter sp. MUD11]|uniref:hypothetical protein n=1 Tax=Aurantiacibacter sp. MUD11 TaxID=3003265 RepID=UPI0022AA2F35|nr:hypothetical protein [Aurantiacibacter sp. MUD11]WAT17025.1 hypothetical protein OZN62_08725 [Aurantiacibacter sp. MUD11]